MNEITTKEEYFAFLSNIKKTNDKIKRAYELLDDSDRNIDKVLEDTTLTKEEFIYVIALGRKRGYSKFSGNGNISMEKQIISEYKNTPWKFVEEFLQNADDCKYTKSPKIEIRIDDKTSSIEFIYNEVGFSKRDIWSLTAFADSTKVQKKEVELQKEGVVYYEKTGRKGIGFKSVFSLDAENIIIHIRSNGYSFKLDKKIATAIPVWEEDTKANDNRTHVIVELINPNFSLESIYPNFKELFCIDNVEELFIKSPILFMHNLKEVEVYFNENYFKTSLLYQNCFYEDKLDEIMKIQSGVFHNGNPYSIQTAKMNIRMESNGKSRIILCYRFVQMVELDESYRNISVIAPLICDENTKEWKGGSLFRTFPMLEHRYQIPISIDAPFELNTSRKGIEYTQFEWNEKVSKSIFSSQGVLWNFFVHLSRLDEIKIDEYFDLSKNVLFDSERNTDGRNYLLEPVDVRKVLCMIPVFRIHEHKTYVSYREIKYVDEELLKWPHIERLIQEENIAASCYKDSELLKRKRVNIFNYAFVKSMNQYLDSVEDVFIFIKNKLYPFLIEHKKEIRLEDLKVYCSTMYDGTKIRESKREDVVWLRAKNNTLLSFDNIRILDSAPIDCSVLDVLEIQNIEDYFSRDNIKRLMKSCKNSIEVQQLQKILEYYGYQLEESVKVSQKKAIDVSEIIKTAEEMNREFTSPFNKTKREYVQALESYRSYLYQYRNLLKLSYEDNFMVSNEEIIFTLLKNINRFKHTKLLIEMEENQMTLKYNENGFDFLDVYKITSNEVSGFKKVFALFDRVEIYSNGFTFYLSSENLTIPRWIDCMDDSCTKMVFKVLDSKKERLARLKEEWISLLKSKQKLLFLENIDKYTFDFLSLKREEITRGYIFKKVEILSLYKKLLKNPAQKLDKQFEGAYLTLCLASNEEGYFYNEVPTKSRVYANIHVQLPLEVSQTGIVSNSDDNKLLKKLVFSNEETKVSIMQYLLEELAREYPDEKIYNYLDEHTHLVSKEQLKLLHIFRDCSTNELISIKEGKFVHWKVYQYLNLKQETKEKLLKVESKGQYKKMIAFGATSFMNDKMVCDYFKNEYNTEVRLLEDTPKDHFLMDELMDYFLDHKVYDICIYPYLYEGQTYLGRLKDEKWYYLEEGQIQTSTQTYHILDTNVLKLETVNRIKLLMSPFDVQEVIQNIVEVMSNEKDYTSKWWVYATNLFYLWKEEKPSLGEATQKINNNQFLFEDGYCSEELKNRLIELEIYREFDDHGLSHEFLKALAVPHEFASDTVIDYRIYSAVFAKAAGYRFPVSEGERYKNCQLIDEIIMSLYHTKRNINRILANYRKQIVVKNVNGQYMSINTDLFYSSEEYQLTDSEFECYHIDETKYDSRYLEAVGIDFLEVEEEFAMYDVEGEEEEFYRWIKSYQSDELTLEEKQIVEYLRNHPERVDEILKRI